MVRHITLLLFFSSPSIASRILFSGFMLLLVSFPFYLIGLVFNLCFLLHAVVALFFLFPLFLLTSCITLFFVASSLISCSSPFCCRIIPYFFFIPSCRRLSVLCLPLSFPSPFITLFICSFIPSWLPFLILHSRPLLLFCNLTHVLVSSFLQLFVLFCSSFLVLLLVPCR